MALAVAGCGQSANGSGNVISSNGVPLVTGEQVITACYQAYFYNGILPKSSAKTNCTSCVVADLRKLGVRPTGGENLIDMLTGERLSSSQIQSLQNSCGVSDANTQ